MVRYSAWLKVKLDQVAFDFFQIKNSCEAPVESSDIPNFVDPNLGASHDFFFHLKKNRVVIVWCGSCRMGIVWSLGWQLSGWESSEVGAVRWEMSSKCCPGKVVRLGGNWESYSSESCLGGTCSGKSCPITVVNTE